MLRLIWNYPMLLKTVWDLRYCDMEKNFKKGTGTKARRLIIVEVENYYKPASKKRCSSSFVNESFNFNGSSLVTQSIS